jgi:hypothetical protein
MKFNTFLTVFFLSFLLLMDASEYIVGRMLIGIVMLHDFELCGHFIFHSLAQLSRANLIKCEQLMLLLI